MGVRRDAPGQHAAAHSLCATHNACTALPVLLMGGTELVRSWVGRAGMVTALHTTQPARIPTSPSHSLHHSRASDAQDQSRLDSGRPAQRWLTALSSTRCSSRVRQLDEPMSSRHRHGCGRAALAGHPGHAAAAGAAHGGSGGGPPAASPCRRVCTMLSGCACGYAGSAARRSDAPQLLWGTARARYTTY